MNILYIGTFRLPRYDAAAARVLTVGKALQDLGHNVSFISWGGKYDEKCLSSNGIYKIDEMPYIIANEIDGKSFSQKLHQKLFRGDKSLDLIQTIEEKPDIIITYNTPYRFNKRLLKYCKCHNIKIIADITEWYDNNELSSLSN